MPTAGLALMVRIRVRLGGCGMHEYVDTTRPDRCTEIPNIDELNGSIDCNELFVRGLKSSGSVKQLATIVGLGKKVNDN